VAIDILHYRHVQGEDALAAHWILLFKKV